MLSRVKLAGKFSVQDTLANSAVSAGGLLLVAEKKSTKILSVLTHLLFNESAFSSLQMVHMITSPAENRDRNVNKEKRKKNGGE